MNESIVYHVRSPNTEDCCGAINGGPAFFPIWKHCLYLVICFFSASIACHFVSAKDTLGSLLISTRYEYTKTLKLSIDVCAVYIHSTHANVLSQANT